MRSFTIIALVGKIMTLGAVLFIWTVIMILFVLTAYYMVRG